MTIEELSGLGRVSKEIEIFKDLKCRMHTLTIKEEAEVNTAVAQYPNDIVVRAGVMQFETLCRAIENIAGRPFVEMKDLREYLSGLQRHILDYFWAAWTEHFDNESAKSVDALKKNSVDKPKD